jgi:DNA-binding NtrC family response regulator
MAAQKDGSAPTAVRPRAALPQAGAAQRTTAGNASDEAVRAVRILRGDKSSVIQLDEQNRYVLGRHDAADVVFDAPEISRLHGVLRFVDGSWAFEDYGSQNGSTLVRLDGIRAIAAHQPVALRAHDVVELGGDHARIELLAEGDGDDAFDDRVSDAATDRAARNGEVSRAARAFAERVRLAARTRVPVFLLGPSGVGKTFSARQIHDASALPGPFVPLNCARLPQEASALHSELLGHVKGAYTGADAARRGKLVHADGGTLFLDEVESLPALAQGFLLDVLDGSGELAPLGAQAETLKAVTFRLMAASKASLSTSGLRPDLCERLAEGHLWRVPGLEERREDIPGLVRRFAAEQEKMLGARVTIAPAAVRFCMEAVWPGQVRQLRSTIVALAQLGLARALEAGSDKDDIVIQLKEADLAAHLAEREAVFAAPEVVRTKADARSLTAAQLKQALAAAGGSKAAAARALGISRNTLAKKLEEMSR